MIKAFLACSSEVALDIIRQRFLAMVGNLDLADEILDIEEAHEVLAFPDAKKVKEQKARVSSKKKDLKEFPVSSARRSGR